MKKNVLCFGEFIREKNSFGECGGGPFLLAAHLCELGNDVLLYSRIGADDNGEWLKKEAFSKDVDITHVQIDRSRLTPVATAVPCKDIPSYVIENNAHEHICADVEQIERISRIRFDVLCMQSLIQCFSASASALSRLLQEVEAREVFYDLSLRGKYFSRKIFDASLKVSTIVCLDEEELKIVSTILYGKMMKPKDFCEEISRRYAIPVIAISGSTGCTVYQAGSLETVEFKQKNIDFLNAGAYKFKAFFLNEFCGGNSAAQSIYSAFEHAKR